MLTFNINKRLTAEQALKHEFFKTGINVSNLLKGKFKENTEILKKFFINEN